MRRCAELAGGVGNVGENDRLQRLYATNGVRRLLPDAEGKKSGSPPRERFEESRPVWRAELETLARHDLLPRAVVVFGSGAWGFSWSALAALCADPQATAAGRARCCSCGSRTRQRTATRGSRRT